MPTSIELVPFHGDMLQATRDESGVWVALRPMCPALGVSLEGQLAKLKLKPWATMKLVFTVGEDGRTREMACIHLDSLPMWLGSIESSRVKDPSLRMKLERYQCEAARVLAAHFFPKASALPAAIDSVIANGPRIGDSPETRRAMFAACRMAARASGTTIGRIQGFIRRVYRLSTPYALGLVYWPSLHEQLVQIGEGHLLVVGPARPKPRLVASVHQLVIPGTSS